MVEVIRRSKPEISVAQDTPLGLEGSLHPGVEEENPAVALGAGLAAVRASFARPGAFPGQPDEVGGAEDGPTVEHRPHNDLQKIGDNLVFIRCMTGLKVGADT